MMRNTLKIFLFLIITLILNGCVKETPMVDRTYQIRNSSNDDVIIRGYINFDGTGSFEDIFLEENQVYVGGEIILSELSNFNNPNNVTPTSSFSYSRFKIVFDNERYMSHSFDVEDDVNIFSDPVERNVLRSGNYTNIGNDIYEFELTQEDYDNAILCHGDCLD